MVFGLQTQPKSWLTGYTFWVNHYLEIVFSKISVVNPPPPPLNEIIPSEDGFGNLVTKIHDLIDQCFLVDEAMLKSKRNRLNRKQEFQGNKNLNLHFSTLYIHNM